MPLEPLKRCFSRYMEENYSQIEINSNLRIFRKKLWDFLERGEKGKWEKKTERQRETESKQLFTEAGTHYNIKVIVVYTSVHIPPTRNRDGGAGSKTIQRGSWYTQVPGVSPLKKNWFSFYQNCLVIFFKERIWSSVHREVVGWSRKSLEQGEYDQNILCEILKMNKNPAVLADDKG